METKKSKVEGMVELLKTEGQTIPADGFIPILWPADERELREFLKAGTISMNGRDREVKDLPSRFLSWAYRGFTLSFQKGGEGLSEEEKAANAAVRKETNAVARKLAAAKKQGVDLASIYALLKERGIDVETK